MKKLKMLFQGGVSMNISPECAVELLEVIKYLDDELKKYIPDGFVIYLESIKNTNYYFEINKNKNLFENEFMDETIEILMKLFIQSQNN